MRPLLRGELLLDHLPASHRSMLLEHVNHVHGAIEAINEQDPYSKGCCWLGVDDRPQIGMEQLVQHIVKHDLAVASDECNLEDIVGFEWWFQVRRGRDLPFHHDT